MTADEREKLCEKYLLDVWYDPSVAEWYVQEGKYPQDILSEAAYRDVAIDLAAGRLAERGLL